MSDEKKTTRRKRAETPAPPKGPVGAGPAPDDVAQLAKRLESMEAALDRAIHHLEEKLEELGKAPPADVGVDDDVIQRLEAIEGALGMHVVGEVAGIAQRYHPDIAVRLDDLDRAVHELESGLDKAAPRRGVGVGIDWTEKRGRVVVGTRGLALMDGRIPLVMVPLDIAVVSTHANGVRIVAAGELVEILCSPEDAVAIAREIGGLS